MPKDIHHNISKGNARSRYTWCYFAVLWLGTVVILRSNCQVLEIDPTTRQFGYVPTNKPTIPVDRTWCPDALCQESVICNPCRRRFLIIVTSGRSASTTLTWMLDLLPGVRMSGENNNAIQNIMEAFQKTLQQPFEFDLRGENAHGAWGHNSIPSGSMACPAQAMIEAINPPQLKERGSKWAQSPQEALQEIVGFKTIRLFRNNTLEDVAPIVEFLKEHFPCSRYVVNYRSDTQKQAQSQVQALKVYKNDRIEESIVRLEAENQRLLKFYKLIGGGGDTSSAYLLDSSRWTKDVKKLNAAIAWLGFDPKYCAFEELLEWNMGKGYGTSGQQRLQMNPKCHYIAQA